MANGLTQKQIKTFAWTWFSAAINDFPFFRRLMSPDTIESWWQVNAARHLQLFYEDVCNGLRPRLIINAPPQHGKSRLLRDFSLWVAGRNPDLKQLFASYSANLGTESNLYLQRGMIMPQYRNCFPKTVMPGHGSMYKCTSDLIEFVDRAGSFRNTTVNGQINGFGLDIGIIDDPIKDRAEAQSALIRDKTWIWLTDNFLARMSKDAGLVMIQTCWHVDDPTGRWIELFENTKVLKYSAIAEEGDWTVKRGFRRTGEALFPELKPLDFLESIRKTLTEASWQSIWQQHPIVAGGGILPIDKFQVTRNIPRGDIIKSVRYWDKAGTAGKGAFTAGVLMHRLKDGRYAIEDVTRGQWSISDRDNRIKQTAQIDKEICPSSYEIWVEQEPGSGGKESAEASVKMLAGFRVFADRVSGQGSKEVRAEPFAAQVQGGNILIKSAMWNREYLNEAEGWPASKYKDQIDASSGAFNKLTRSSWDPTLRWV